MNNSLIFKPTLLQRILGRNYKWWYLLWYEFKISNGHFYSYIFLNIVRSVEFLIIIFVWQINNSSAEIITYLAIGRVFQKIVSSGFGGVVGSYIDSGQITKDLIRPQNILFYYYIKDLGFNQIRQILNAIIILVLAVIVFGSQLIFSWQVGWLIIILPIASLIRFFMNMLIGTVAFWIKERANNTAVINGIYLISGILAGEIIPLSLIFQNNFNFLQFSPFAYFLHLPMQIYLGKYSLIETLNVFLGGIAWCLVFYCLAKIVFQAGLKKNESVGL